MNRLGINLWNFIEIYSDSQVGLIDHVSKLGFTAVELPLASPEVSAEPIRDSLVRNGLALSVCAAMTKGRDLSSFDPAERQTGYNYLRSCLRLLSEAGGDLLCGPLYAGGGKAHALSEADRAREWQLAVENLSRLADEAAALGLRLALEPLHRYRTSVVNTVEQALALCDCIGRDNVGVHFDSYHANIEEADLLLALEAVLRRNKLFHFHACANDRGIPGSRHLPWPDIWSLLKRYGYHGTIAMETFAHPGIEAVWRKPPLSPDETASAGLGYLQKIFK